METDPLLLQLAFRVFVAIQAELGVVGEVGGELDEEGAEALVQDVEVVLVHHDLSAIEPRVRGARLRIAAFLRAKGGRLLLGLAHKNNAFVPMEGGQALQEYVVLALSPLKGDQRDSLVLGKSLNPPDEALRHGVHEGRGRKGVASVVPKELNHSTVVLQVGYVGVEVQPIDALDLQGHVILEVRRNTPCYVLGHGGFQSLGCPTGIPTASRGLYGDRLYRSPLVPATGPAISSTPYTSLV